MSNPSDILILAPEETELKKVKGDCWRTPDFSGNRQVPGQYTFTNQRILFRGNGLIEKLRITFAIAYEDISTIRPFNINLFIHTGIQIELKNGSIYKLSVMKRDQVVSLIHEQMRTAG